MKLLKKFFKRKTEEEMYLSQAYDLHDLEQRIKNIQKGKAPFQSNLRYTYIY